MSGVYIWNIVLIYKSRISKKKAIDYDIIDNKLIVYSIIRWIGYVLAMELAIQYIQCLYECNVMFQNKWLVAYATNF